MSIADIDNSQFLKDGEWAENTQATYVKAPGAAVKFK